MIERKKLARRLESLLKQASPGEWHCGCFADPKARCQCKSILTDQMMGAVGTIIVREKGDQFASEYPTVREARANLNLIVELHNALPTIIAALGEP